MKFLFIIFISGFFLTNCSLIGASVGTMSDYKNSKKPAGIISQNQKITLEFVDNRKVEARYRALSYSDTSGNTQNMQLAMGRNMSNMNMFPQIDEEITVFVD